MPEVQPTIYIEASEVILPQEKWNNGVKIILRPDMRRERCDIKSIAMQPSVLAIQEAVENGAEEVVFVKDGYVSEGSHTSFCVVEDNKVKTYPSGKSILPGITRMVIKEICDELNIEFVEEAVPSINLAGLKEMFIIGTTTEVMPVIRVENKLINNGIVGETTKKLQAVLRHKIMNTGI